MEFTKIVRYKGDVGQLQPPPPEYIYVQSMKGTNILETGFAAAVKGLAMAILTVAVPLALLIALAGAFGQGEVYRRV